MVGIGLNICALATLGSMTAFAKPISFDIYRTDGVIQVASNTKDVTGDYFRISNFKPAESYYFIEDKDVIGFRVKNPAGTISYSKYHTFSKFVDRYPLKYLSTPAMRASLRLNSQIDSTGQYDFIRFTGEWIS